MPVADPRGEPERVVVPGGWSGWSGRIAALVAFGLGVLAAIMMVAGHPPWDGPEVVALFGTHGLHQGDVLALLPLLAGTGLAWWCLHRPSPAVLAELMARSLEGRTER